MRLPVSYGLTGLLLAILCAPVFADEPTTKPGVPNAAALRKATALVDQQYREDVAKARDPEAKSALAKKILDAAKDEEKPDVKYALLNKAAQSAIAAGDAQAASDAVEQIEASWQLDAAKLRSETLVKTARQLRTADDQSTFVRLVSPMIDKMVAEKKFDPAKSLNDAALSAAQKAGDSAAVKELTARGAGIVERRTAESRVAYATNVLQNKPNDPVANTAVGKYQCYIDDNWAEGLAKLQHGNDAALKGLADKELAQDATPEAKNAAADGWWDLARHEGELARRHIQQHARHCTPPPFRGSQARAGRRRPSVYRKLPRPRAPNRSRRPRQFRQPNRCTRISHDRGSQSNSGGRSAGDYRCHRSRLPRLA